MYFTLLLNEKIMMKNKIFGYFEILSQGLADKDKPIVCYVQYFQKML